MPKPCLSELEDHLNSLRLPDLWAGQTIFQSCSSLVGYWQGKPSGSETDVRARPPSPDNDEQRLGGCDRFVSHVRRQTTQDRTEI